MKNKFLHSKEFPATDNLIQYENMNDYQRTSRENTQVRNAKIKEAANEIEALYDDSISDDEAFISETSSPPSFNRKRKTSDTSQNQSSPIFQKSSIGKKGKSWKELLNGFLGNH